MPDCVTFTVPGRLPGLNEYTRACRNSARIGNNCKKAAQRTVRWGINAAHLEPIVEGSVHVAFLWIEPNRRRDLDNVAFAKKFVLDELVDAEILTDDRRKHVAGFQDRFGVDPRNPRVIVTIERIGS
jgi:Holliday junction resolvase RusA-like endonuclease